MTLVGSCSNKFLVIDISRGIDLLLIDLSSGKVKRRFQNSRPSSHLHSLIYSFLKENNLDKSEIEYVFNLGPGSYTGLRLLKGFADVLNQAKLKTYSFWGFELLEVLGCDYKWISPAFKGQFFLCDYTTDQLEYRLIDQNTEIVEGKYIGIRNVKEIYPRFIWDLEDEIYISLIKRVTEEKRKREIFYYRKLEDEYKIHER